MPSDLVIGRQSAVLGRRKLGGTTWLYDLVPYGDEVFLFAWRQEQPEPTSKRWVLVLFTQFVLARHPALLRPN